MFRLLVIAASLLHVVAPRRVVDAAERLAFENPDAGQLRPSTLPLARLEGVVFGVLIARRGLSEPLKAPLTLLGAVLAVIPRQMLKYGLAMAYENPEDLEVKPWVLPAVRLLGACYLVVGLFAGRVRADGSVDELATSGPKPRTGTALSPSDS